MRAGGLRLSRGSFPWPPNSMLCTMSQATLHVLSASAAREFWNQKAPVVQILSATWGKLCWLPLHGIPSIASASLLLNLGSWNRSKYVGTLSWVRVCNLIVIIDSLIRRHPPACWHIAAEQDLLLVQYSHQFVLGTSRLTPKAYARLHNHTELTKLAW